MKSVNLGTQISQMTIATVLIGLVSFIFNYVVARVLTIEDAARVMTLWTVINSCLLIVQLPIELYSPRLLRLMVERDHGNHFDSLVLVYIGLTSVITFVLFFCYYIIRYEFKYEEILVFTLLIGSSSLFNLFRTINIARQNLGRLLISALYLSLGSSLIFSLMFLMDINSAKGPLLAVSFGFILAGTMSLRSTGITQLKLMSTIQNRSLYLETFSFREVSTLFLSNLVSLLLVSGGAVFTGLVGLTTEETVVYLGSIALALIPVTVLNSTTLAVYLRAINVFGDRNMTQFKLLFLKSALVYFFISVVIVLSFSLIGETIFLAFLGDKYRYSQMVLTFSSIAVCLSFMGSIPRLFLMALGRTTQTYIPLLLTVGLYLALVLTIRSGYVGLYTSSIVSSLFIFAGTCFLLQRNIQSLSSKIL